MSVWKKASKINQKVHRERHQPEARKHLGVLEKHKDYKKRATNENEKRDTLKLLHRRAQNKNPDEFYYHMINSKVNNGVHHEVEKVEENTPEQLMLMKTQDLKYITFKRTQEFKKIERLQAQLHLSSIITKPKNKHIYFSKKPKREENDEFEYLANIKLPDIDVESLQESVKKRRHLYAELSKRVNREKELAVIQQKLYLKQQLEAKSSLKPRRVKKGSKDRAPVYKWKYERKR